MNFTVKNCSAGLKRFDPLDDSAYDEYAQLVRRSSIGCDAQQVNLAGVSGCTGARWPWEGVESAEFGNSACCRLTTQASPMLIAWVLGRTLG